MGPGSDPGTGPEMGGYRVSATRKSHRRNFSVPSPQVSFTRYARVFFPEYISHCLINLVMFPLPSAEQSL
jgi:hypothetical protein